MAKTKKGGKRGGDSPPDQSPFPAYKSEAIPWLIATKLRFKLTIGSPPYALKGRRYDQTGEVKGKIWKPLEWAEWMAKVTYYACQRTDGFVLWVVDSPVSKGEYHPAVELLQTEVYRNYHDSIKCERPVVWHKNAAPSRHNSKTGGQDWFSHDYEMVVPFFRRDLAERPVLKNWEAIATPPKFEPGGAFRQRDQKGERKVGEPVKAHKLARPRDVRRYLVGGGHLGSKLAHEGEAPYPESLVTDFVLPLTDKGELVFDPFLGSGTTAAVAERLGREWLGLDIRQSQIELTKRRIEEVRAAL